MRRRRDDAAPYYPQSRLVATGEKDLNTALREAEEEANKKIQALGQ
jgi:8-oxo-dGTP pyrophosphatase MutT (NUDIX family)